MSDLETNARASTRYDSETTPSTEGDDRHSIRAYVSDMLALERHIAVPLARQLELDETARFGDARSLIDRVKSTTDTHVKNLEQLLEQLGGNAASPIKSAWSSLLGVGAAAIGSVRKTKVSKSLRDDYTALGLASMGYTMLHATAVGMGDAATAGLARQHLADEARLVMQIAQAMPAVVLLELQADGETIATGAAETIRRETNDIWRSQADVTQP